MIIILTANATKRDVKKLTDWIISTGEEPRAVSLYGETVLVTSASWQADKQKLKTFSAVKNVINPGTEYQLCTRQYHPKNTIVDMGDGIVFGSDKTVLMAGPCAVESKEQIMSAAQYLTERHNVQVFRAGAFKPRTSIYSFQGLGSEGLQLLTAVRKKYGVKIITEVKDTTHFNEVAEVADIIQVGTKSMYNFSLLRMCGQSQKPIMLKRGFMATIKEFLQAADVILAEGNPNVILCERGIRTFEQQTRFSLDVCAAALLKEITHLPLVLDPAHAMGKAKQVPLVAQAAAGMEVDGIMVEVHPNPAEAQSDKDQALSFDQVDTMIPKLHKICQAVGRSFV